MEEQCMNSDFVSLWMCVCVKRCEAAPIWRFWCYRNTNNKSRNWHKPTQSNALKIQFPKGKHLLHPSNNHTIHFLPFFWFQCSCKKPRPALKTWNFLLQWPGLSFETLPQLIVCGRTLAGKAVIYISLPVIGWKECPVFHFDQMWGLKTTHCCKLSWSGEMRWSTLHALLLR